MKLNTNNHFKKLALSFITVILFNTSSIGQVKNDSLKVAASIEKIINEAQTLIQSAEPEFKPYKIEKTDSNKLADLGFEQVYENIPQSIEMRDQKKLFGFLYPAKSNTTIILLHGALSTAYLYNKTAGMLRDATNAQVLALDCRGHGQSDGNKGDINYIGQYTDDLADVVTYLRKGNPNNKIIIAGHSMGGGIALKYAMKQGVPEVDGYLFFAPLLGKNAPTLPKIESKNQDSEFIKAHIPRILGLKILNLMQRHELDSLPVVYFNLPKEFPFRTYTHRANESMSPADYKDGLLAVNKPMLVLVGSADEAFVASEYKPAVEKFSKGKVVVLNGLTHSGIRHSKKAMEIAAKWCKDNFY